MKKIVTFILAICFIIGMSASENPQILDFNYYPKLLKKYQLPDGINSPERWLESEFGKFPHLIYYCGNTAYVYGKEEITYNEMPRHWGWLFSDVTGGYHEVILNEFLVED